VANREKRKSLWYDAMAAKQIPDSSSLSATPGHRDSSESTRPPTSAQRSLIA